MVEYKLVLLLEQDVGLFGSYNSLGGDMASGELFFNCSRNNFGTGYKDPQVLCALVAQPVAAT